MLSVVSGGEVIRDVPACFAENAMDDNQSIPTRRSRPIPDGRLKNTHRRRTAGSQPSLTCKNLDCPPRSLRLLQVKSD